MRVRWLCYTLYLMPFSTSFEPFFLSFLEGETSKNKQSMRKQIFGKLDEHKKAVIHERNRVYKADSRARAIYFLSIL
jgi:hypothetical protein